MAAGIQRSFEWGFPGERLEAYAEAVKALAKANTVLSKFHTERRQAVESRGVADGQGLTQHAGGRMSGTRGHPAQLWSRRVPGRKENMLINTSPRRPNLERVRQIKEALRAALSLPDGTTVKVTELACLEEGCAPIETVVALLQPDAPVLQYKLHKPTDAIDAEDLVQICMAWGFDVKTPIYELCSRRTE